MKSLKLAALFAVSLTFVGCEGLETPGNEDAYQSGSNHCSSQFVSDHNRVEREGGYLPNASEVNEFEQLVNSFANKYPGVRCKAGLTSSTSLEESEAMIDANAKVSEWRSKIASWRSRNAPQSASTSGPSTSAPSTRPSLPPVTNPGPMRTVCSDSFVSDFNRARGAVGAAVDRAQTVTTRADVAELTRLTDEGDYRVSLFDSRHGRTRCWATTTAANGRTTEQEVDGGAEATKLKDVVKLLRELIAKF